MVKSFLVYTLSSEECINEYGFHYILSAMGDELTQNKTKVNNIFAEGKVYCERKTFSFST